ncbi:ABC transporter permease [Actinoplanes sp. NPDC051861]|uniref:ABC transporter permease n=1 Tax=Actinoplanes sp. NPDC051861 TaxID=3155170 RepID=UPI003421727C
MTVTNPDRVYPAAVEDLIPHARELAAQLGRLPSRNQLKRTLRVGAPKARALLEAITPAPPADPPVPLDELTTDPDPVIEPTEPESAVESNFDTTQVSTAPLDTPAVDPVPVAVTDAPVAMAETAATRRKPLVWPVLILCLPAFVAIWGGWVEMGRFTGFGVVTLLPGISDFQLDTAITLPIGVETYAAYALYVWLSGRVNETARRFARGSAIFSLVLGGLGQITYHLMASAGWTTAPWPITAIVACIPVAVLGMGAALAHLMHAEQQ